MARMGPRACNWPSALAPRIALATAPSRIVETETEEEPERNEEERREMDDEIEIEIEIEIDDHQVLDCSNCFPRLRPPLYQGNAGHVTCPSCSNELLGCPARIAYYQKDAHESTCPLVLCACPETSCNFSGSSVRLLEHWRDEHNWAFRTFNYGTTFHITFSYTPSYRVLVDDKSDKMFVLSVSRVSHGVALSVVCVGPSSLPDPRGPKYSYKLTVERDDHGSGAGSSCSRSRGTGVEFRAPVMSSTLQNGLGDTNGFLELVPDSEDFCVCVCIHEFSIYEF